MGFGTSEFGILRFVINKEFVISVFCSIEYTIAEHSPVTARLVPMVFQFTTYKTSNMSAEKLHPMSCVDVIVNYKG